MNQTNNVSVWGLTGGIASGKSTVAKVFQDLGLAVIDADKIAKELTEKGGRAYPFLIQKFGTADREELKKLIFSDPKAKKQLEELMHPFIQEESARKIVQLNTRCVIYEAALLVETKRYQELSGLIVVTCSPEIQSQRLLKRDQIDLKLAQSIIHSQSTDSEKIEVADYIINNSGSLDDLKAQVKNIFEKITTQ